MSDETHPDSPSGQPYSAPTRAWGGNADPRNLSYDGARYFGPGYEQPNNVPWDGRPPQSHLPPPDAQAYLSPGQRFLESEPPPPGFGEPRGPRSKRRSWFARHKVLTGLLAVVAFFLVLGIIGAVTA